MLPIKFSFSFFNIKSFSKSFSYIFNSLFGMEQKFINFSQIKFFSLNRYILTLTVDETFLSRYSDEVDIRQNFPHSKFTTSFRSMLVFSKNYPKYLKRMIKSLSAFNYAVNKKSEKNTEYRIDFTSK